jgi:hypothetical protein
MVKAAAVVLVVYCRGRSDGLPEIMRDPRPDAIDGYQRLCASGFTGERCSVR